MSKLILKSSEKSPLVQTLTEHYKTHGYLVIGPVLSLNHGTGVGSAVVWGRLGTLFISGIDNY